MFKNIIYGIALALTISCGTNKTKINSQTSEQKKPQPYSISYSKPSSVYTLGDSIVVKMQINNDALEPDSVTFQIGVQKTTFIQNAHYFTIVSNEIEKVGSKTLVATFYSSNTSYTSHLQITLLSDIAPKQKTFSIEASYPHDLSAYTQGLEFCDGELYESTGLHGMSTVRKVDLKTGKVLQTVSIDQQYFGEGITIIDNRIIYLTWQTNIGFIYDKESLKQIGSFNYTSEGWGLTNNGEEVIMSDGSNKLRFLNKVDLSELRTLEVFDNYNQIDKLNELEYIDGYIYANVYTKDYIVKIDPQTGKVLEKILLKGILKEADKHQKIDVLNGIAYDKTTGKIYVTGKNWPKIFEIKIIDLII